MKRCCLLFAFLSAAVSSAQQPFLALHSHAGGQTVVCAHRGRTSAAEDENSVTVMKHTVSQGIPMVEFDLRKSSDGVMFLLHDQTLDRTTDASGPIAARTADELRHVLLRNPESKAPREPLNRFDDLLAWAETANVALMVDLKSTSPSDAVAALRKHGLVSHAVLLTFDQKTTSAALASDPAVLVSELVTSKPQIDAAVAEAKGHPIALYLPGTADSALFLYARGTGKLTITDAMDTIDAPAATKGGSVYRDFLSTHPVDVLVTNRALDLRKALSR